MSDQGQAHSAYGHSMAAAGGCGSGGQQAMAARLHSSASPHSCTIPLTPHCPPPALTLHLCFPLRPSRTLSSCGSNSVLPLSPCYSTLSWP